MTTETEKVDYSQQFKILQKRIVLSRERGEDRRRSCKSKLSYALRLQLQPRLKPLTGLWASGRHSGIRPKLSRLNARFKPTPSMRFSS